MLEPPLYLYKSTASEVELTTACLEVDQEVRPTVSTRKAKRRCAICGTVLTWNPDVVCCCCEDKLDRERETDHRTKIAPCDYPLLLARREEGWTHSRIAKLYGVTTNYMCELVNKIQREQK